VTIASRQPITLAVAQFEDIVSRGLQALIDEDPNLRLVVADVEQDQLSSTLSDHRPDLAILNSARWPVPAISPTCTPASRAPACSCWPTIRRPPNAAR
jgi:hypothetical protein